MISECLLFTIYIFTQDTTVKIWDIREPRACLRSHRLMNLTWGLNVEWTENNCVQVSGDSGGIFSIDTFVSF